MDQAIPGTFYGVGVGPGDPELITRKAERILASVDSIYHPASSGTAESFARRIVAPLGLPEHKFRPVFLGMARDRTAARNVYRRVAVDVAEELRQGRSAAWITEGDPLFYSTFLYVREQLRHVAGVHAEVIPGVTSPSAAAARAGVAIAHLDEKVAMVPAAYGLTHLPRLLQDFATVFLLKVPAVFQELLTILAGLPPEFHVFYVESVGTQSERVVTDLDLLRGQEPPYFSMVIVRKERPLDDA